MNDKEAVMAKTKAELEEEKETATGDAADRPAWEGTMSASEPLVAADGHVTLSQEDIDARNLGGA